MEHVKSEHQDWVQTFMRAVEQGVPDVPSLKEFPFDLRIGLILEEALEFVKACGYVVDVETQDGFVELFGMDFIRLKRDSDPDFVEMLDALGDLLYVVYGAASSTGVDIDPIFEEIHRTNMNKLGGGVRESDGKRLKPEGWQPPRLKRLLDLQIDIATKDLSDHVPQGMQINIPGGTQGQDNVTAIRKAAKIHRTESPGNERFAEHTPSMLRQTCADLSRQLSYIAGKGKQNLTENSYLTQKLFAKDERIKELEGIISEYEDRAGIKSLT